MCSLSAEQKSSLKRRKRDKKQLWMDTLGEFEETLYEPWAIHFYYFHFSGRLLMLQLNWKFVVETWQTRHDVSTSFLSSLSSKKTSKVCVHNEQTRTNKAKIHTRHKIFHKYFIMPRNKTQMAKMYKNCEIKSILRSFRVSLERSGIIIKSSLVPRSYPYLFSFFARFAFVIQTHESRTNNKSHKWLLEKQEERNIQQEGK